MLEIAAIHIARHIRKHVQASGRHVPLKSLS
ncbi:hypothetical protein FHY26_001941 [Xanthomonas campestris]